MILSESQEEGLGKQIVMELSNGDDNINVDLKLLVKRIIQDFFEWIPLSKISEAKLENELAVELQSDPGLEKFQNCLLNGTIKSEIFQNFPVSQKRSQNLIKKIILILENLGVEVREELYNFMSRSGVDLRNYKSYFFNDNYLLSLIERDALICEGSTGLVTWSSAKILTRWLNDRPDLLKGHILELGAGLGYTGISLVKLGLVRSRLTITDYHHSVLQALCHNVEINLALDQGWVPKDSSDCPDNLLTIENKETSTTVSVCALNWMTFGDAFAEELSPNIVIGADIVFDGDLLPFLVKTINLCMTENESGLAIIAGEVRNEKTINNFENLLEKSSLVFRKEVVTSSPPVFIMKIQRS